MMNNVDYSEAVVTPGAPEGPYQVWIYMLNDCEYSAYADSSVINVVRMYDTHDAWDPSYPTVENGNLVHFTVESNNYYQAGTEQISPPDADLTSYNTHNASSKYRDNLVGTPILKLINVNANVKSIYIGFYRPDYAFDLKFELHDSSSNVLSEYSDTNLSALTGQGSGGAEAVWPISSMLAEAHSKWNIPDLISTDNITIPKVLVPSTTPTSGANTYEVVESSSVNYANVYLYGTDNVSSANDAMAVKEVPATTTVLRETTLVSIDFYFKDPASADGFVVSDNDPGTTNIALTLAEIRLYSLPDWQGVQGDIHSV